MQDIVQLIKQTSMESFNESSPTSRAFGIVTSINPLIIKIDEKLQIKNNMIELTTNVIDFEIEIELLEDVNIEDSLTIKESLHRKRKYKIYNGLKVGEKVIMLRVEKGQKYIVLDRMVSP